MVFLDTCGAPTAPTSNRPTPTPPPAPTPSALEARSCSQGPTSSPPLTVTVGDPDVFEILRFEASGCTVGGVCLVATGQTITFDLAFSHPPDHFEADWNADGTPDEALPPAATATHTYWTPGAYRPTLTARRGTHTTTLQHEDYLLVSGDDRLIFRDGFESGDVSGWSDAGR
jgi:hypothetical protein